MDILPVTGIIGPCQGKKTTFVKNTALNERFLYLELEGLSESEKLENGPAFFLFRIKNRCVILNEIWFLPQSFKE